MWMQYPEDPPFRISGGATVWHLDKLYLIGGYSVEYDCELKSFYQSPVTSVWIFDPSVGKWTMGPPLPKESFVTKNKTIRYWMFQPEQKKKTTSTPSIVVLNPS